MEDQAESQSNPDNLSPLPLSPPYLKRVGENRLEIQPNILDNSNSGSGTAWSSPAKSPAPGTGSQGSDQSQRKRKGQPGSTPRSKIPRASMASPVNPDEDCGSDLESCEDTETESDEEDESESACQTSSTKKRKRLPHITSIRLLQCPAGLSGEEAVDSIMIDVNVCQPKFPFLKAKLDPVKLAAIQKNQQTMKKVKKIADFSQEEVYNVSVYKQKRKHPPRQVDKWAVLDPQIRINELVFLYRGTEIFVITFGTAHLVVQQFSCFQFPVRIMKRVCSDDLILSAKTTDIVKGTQRTYKSGDSDADKNSQSCLQDVFNYVEKPVQEHCSIYGLDAFKAEKETESEEESKSEPSRMKIGFGHAYIKIGKRIGLDFMPEVFWYLSLIHRGKSTFNVQDGTMEVDSELFMPLLKVPSQSQEPLESNLMELVQDYVIAKQTGQQNLENHELLRRFRNGTLATWPIEDATGCHVNEKRFSELEYPPALDKLMEEVCSLPMLQNASAFSPTRFAETIKKVQVEFHVRNGQNKKRNVLQIFQGEMFHPSTGYCLKVSGNWNAVSDQCHQIMHKQFLFALRRFMKDSGEWVKIWNLNGKNLKETKVEEYTQLYEKLGIDDCSKRFVALPSPSSLFDMMSLDINKDGTKGFTVYSVFNGFDDGIRKKYLDLERSLNACMPFGSSTKEMEERLYNQLVKVDAAVREEFPNFDVFHKKWTKNMENKKISVVLMFATVEQGSDRNLKREKGLLDKMSWNGDDKQGFKDIIVALLHKNDNGIREKLCAALSDGMEGNGLDCKDVDGLTGKLKEKMLQMGYLTQKEECSGKLLKMKNVSEFNLFPIQFQNVNNALFEAAYQSCLTGFPGLLHKHCVIRLFRNRDYSNRFNLKIAEILLETM